MFINCLKIILRLKLNFFTKTTQVNLITQVCQKQQQQQTNKKKNNSIFCFKCKTIKPIICKRFPITGPERVFHIMAGAVCRNK